MTPIGTAATRAATESSSAPMKQILLASTVTQKNPDVHTRQIARGPRQLSVFQVSLLKERGISGRGLAIPKSLGRREGSSAACAHLLYEPPSNGRVRAHEYTRPGPCPVVFRIPESDRRHARVPAVRRDPGLHADAA